MNRKVIERLSMEANLRSALTRQEFVVYYQPKIDAITHEMIGAEALIRWNHPRLGIVAPGSFIGIAEESGLILPIGAWVSEHVCRQNLTWLQGGLPCVPLSVNLSALQFRDKSLAQSLASMLENNGMLADLFELELTESVIMQGTEAVLGTLNDLKALGIGLSIDDFGTGYSSLSYLTRFPIDTLKIDQAFVRDIPQDEDGAAIIKAIIGMGHSLRMKVFAEGVETEEQFEFLKAHQCDQIQGYYFSKPLSATEFAALLKKSKRAPHMQPAGH